MAATGSDDDATATFKGDDEEQDFGQEAEKAKAKSDDAEASGCQSYKR